MDQGDALLQHAGHAGVPAGGQPDRHPVAAQPVVVGIVAPSAGTGKTRGQVDADVGAAQRGGELTAVEDVGAVHLGPARGRHSRRLGPAGQGPHPVSGGHQPRHQVAGVDAVGPENGDGQCHERTLGHHPSLTFVAAGVWLAFVGLLAAGLPIAAVAVGLPAMIGGFIVSGRMSRRLQELRGPP